MSKVETTTEIRKGVSQGFGEKNRTKVPVQLLFQCARFKRFERGLQAYLKVKMQTARVQLLKKEMKDWQSALRLGLVFEDPNNNRKIYLKSYKDFSKVRVEFTRNDIETNLFAAVNAVIIQYGLVIQEGARDNSGGLPKEGKINRKQRELKPSVHNNGMSLSLMANATGRSKSSCSRARRKIEAAGLGVFTRRSILISHAAGDERQRVLSDDHGGNGYLWTDGEGRLYKEITSLAAISYYTFCYKKIYKHSKKERKHHRIVKSDTPETIPQWYH